MKAVSFFADTIQIVAHTSSSLEHLEKPITLAAFANGRPLALYQMENGDLRAEVRGGRGVPTVFIEGPEFVPDQQPVASIQIQTTIHTEDAVEACGADNAEATHWSVYTRDAQGLATWVADYPIKSKNPGNVGTAKTSALVRAAKLSMEHLVFIEPIQGE